MSNAILLAPSHRVAVSVRASEGIAEIVIKDPGWIPDMISTEFERFYRVDQARSRVWGTDGSVDVAVC